MSERVLDERTAPPEPFSLFRSWYQEARADPRNPLPEAMALATAAVNGAPSVRFVLLKEIDDRGIIFFSNYEGRKGGELASNPRAAAVILWPYPRRQVRLEGAVERLTAAESDRYFATRDPGSQVGAWASPQSRVVPSREALEAMVDEAAKRFEGNSVPRPDHWGGYLVRAESVEFWSGRENRLHDRLRYRRGEYGWVRERLAP